MSSGFAASEVAIHLGELSEPLLALEQSREHLQRFGLARLDRQRLFEELDGAIARTLSRAHLGEQVHFVIRVRVEANDLFEVRRRLLGLAAREQQSRELGAALDVSRVQAHGVAELSNGEGRELRAPTAADEGEVEAPEHAMRRRLLGIELDRRLRRTDGAVDLPRALVEPGEGDVGVGGRLIERDGALVLFDRLVDLHLHLVHSTQAEVIVGRAWIGGGGLGLSRFCE